MKLCLVAPSPPPYGGIANWTNIICRKINNQQSDIELSLIDISPMKSYVERKNTFSHLWGSFKALKQQQKKLLNEIKSSRPDVIHLTTSGRMSFIRDYVLVTVMKKYDIPCVYHIHFGRVPQIVREKSIEHWIMSRILAKAYKTIAIDPKTYKCLQEKFPSVKSVYIPNPVERHGYLENDYESRKEILYVGWVVKTKGIEELLCAWKNMRQKFLDYSLHLIGPYSEEYKKYLCDKFDMEKVVMEGELTHEETLRRIQRCSVLVLPSYTEGFPNVILEAMVAKKPIVATRVGAIPEMLSDDAGILIDPKQIGQIEEALCELISNPSYQERIAENAYQRAMSLYEINVVFAQYLNAWRLEE